MPGRVVERREVVIVELDLGPLHHPVPEADEDVLDLALGPHQEVVGGHCRARRARQGDVDRVLGEDAVELGGLELVATRGELLLERRPGGVGRGPHGAALVRGKLGDPPQDRRQLRLAPEMAHAQLLQLACVGDARDRGLCLGPQLLDPVGHGHGGAPPSAAADDIPCRAIAAAAATLSDSAASSRTGIVQWLSQAPITRSGRPSRSAPRHSVTGAAVAVGASPPWAISAIRGCGVSPTSARARPMPKIEPMLARTAFGECGSAQPGPIATVPSTRACAERITAPTLPGSPSPCMYTQTGPPAAPQASGQTAIARVPEPSDETESSRPGSTSSPPRPVPGAFNTNSGSRPARRPASSKSSPSVANSPSRSRWRRSASLRTSLSFWLSVEVIM